MSNMEKLEIYDLFFEHQVKLMYAGIENTMEKKETLYTCALALSTYTEVMGGLVTGNLRKRNNSNSNYTAFLTYLGKRYVNLNDKLKEQKSSIHEIIRSKLVHEFALRESHVIMNSEKPSEDKIGIEISFFNNQITQIGIFVKEYYRDFKNGVKKYYRDLAVSAHEPPCTNGQILFVNFMNAMVVDSKLHL